MQAIKNNKVHSLVSRHVARDRIYSFIFIAILFLKLLEDKLLYHNALSCIILICIGTESLNEI